MVYKKYVYKRGKRHGPYYYHSYRDGESVRKVYIGGKEEYGEWLKKRQENKEKSRTTFQLPFITKKKYSLIIPIAILLIIIGFVIYNYQITGKASLDIQNSYIAGENISGVLKLGLKKGELLPIDSKIVIEQEGVIKEYPLAQFVNANSEGKFFIENTELSGNGLGYGFSGEKETYPAVFFRLKIYSEQETKKEPEEPTKKPEENITEEKPSEEIIETPEETTKPEATTETPTEESEVSKSEITKTEEETGGSLITGEVISETAEEEEEIEESCSKDNPFVYQLGAGKSAEIKQGSVEIETFDENGNTIREKISENAVNLQISDSQANVTTDYSITKGGFGQEFLTDEQEFLEISLKDLGIIAEQGILKISLVYEDKTLVEVSEEISVEQPAERKIEEIENETVVTPTENITAGENTTLIENITEINITITNLTLIKAIPEIEIAKNSNFSLDLNEYFANAESYSIEKIENISVTPQKNILTIIPDINFIGERQARVIANRENESVESNLFNIIVYETNITITTIQEKAVIGRPVRWKKSVKLEKPENITIKLPKEAKEINVYKFTEKDKDVEIEEDITSRLTGQITAELDLEKEGILTRLWKKLISSLTGRAIAEINESEEIEVMLQENATEYEITYETEAPQAYEENITNGKRIIVSGPDALHYENVLAYTNINEIVSVENKDKIKLYWLKETGKEQEIGKEQEQEENLSAGQLIENISEEINISKIENITEEVNVSLQKITDETIQTQEKTSETFDSTGLITGQAVLEENITGETSETNGSESNLLINESNESIAEQVGQGIKEVIREIVNINETQEQISQQIIRKEINFTAYDLDNDGMIDYIEWNAERLSNQTYELIIEISKAEHLDENRTFLSDVYEQVKALDNNWS